MICKNCSAEFDDSAAQCPECGMENETVTESFTEGFAKDDEEDKSAETPCEVTENEQSEEEASLVESSDAVQETEPDEASSDDGKAADGDDASEKQEEKPAAKVPERKAVNRTAPVRRPIAARENGARAARRRPVRITKQEKRTISLIVAVMCFVGLCAGVAACLNISTELFSVDTSTDKIVAGVALTSAEEKELEELLANCYSVAKNEFNSESITVEEMLEKINPADKGNIYSRLNNTSEKLQTTADPAKRFVDENGEYAYYKLSEKRVDAVLSRLGLEAYRGESTESCYYCEGYYYFASKPADGKLVGAEVTKTRRILDGRYYAEFYFYVENEGKIKKSKTRYLVFEMDENETTGKVSFVLERTSSKDFVSSDGKLSAEENSYSRKKEVIEGYTKDGILYCRYVIEYPVLKGDSVSCKNLNAMFENAVSVYKMKIESVDADYKSFKRAGGDEKQLPYIENVVASIVFEDEKNISFVERIYKLEPGAEASEQEESYYYTSGQEAEPEARLYDIAIESYTIDKQSGDFVSKDGVVGKDYTLVAEVLYRIYKGYDYERVLPWNEGEEYYYDETPADTDGYGAAIYDSAWARTKSGISFWYKTTEGYITEVTIPSKVAKKLAKLT